MHAHRITYCVQCERRRKFDVYTHGPITNYVCPNGHREDRYQVGTPHERREIRPSVPNYLTLKSRVNILYAVLRQYKQERRAAS